MVAQTPKSRLRKFFKILLVIIGIFLVLLITIYVVIRIKYPAQRLRAMAIEELSKSLNRKVDVGKVWLNVFRGFIFEDITIYELLPPDTELTRVAPFVKINKIYLDYKFSSLFKRTLAIKEVIIDRPQIWLTCDAQGRWNFDDLVVPTMTEDSTEMAAGEELQLPLSLELNHFELRNLFLDVNYAMGDRHLWAQIESLGAKVDQLYVPRGSELNIKKELRARLNIFSRNSSCKFSIQSAGEPSPIDIAIKLNLDMKIRMAGLANIHTQAHISLGEVSIQRPEPLTSKTRASISPLLAVDFEAFANAEQGRVQLTQMFARLGDELLIEATGSVENMQQGPFIDLTVVGSRIRLDKVLQIIKELSPDEYKKLLSDIDVRGELSFLGTRAYGYPTSPDPDRYLDFEASATLNLFSLRYPEPKTKIDHAFLKIIANGKYGLHGVQGMVVEGRVTVPEMTSFLNDTLQIRIREIDSRLKASLSENLFPQQIQISSRIKNIFDSRIELNFDFNSERAFKKFSAEGNITVNHLNLELATQSALKGTANLDAFISSQSLDKIDLTLNLETDSLYLAKEDGFERLSPIAVTGLAEISTDEDFKDFHLREWELFVGDLLAANGYGKMANLGRDGFTFDLDKAVVDHQALFEFIPSTFKAGYENLRISGTTQMVAHIRGRLPAESEPQYQADAKVHIKKTSVEYPEQLLKIGEVDGTIDIRADAQNAYGLGEVTIDNVSLGGVRDKPLSGIYLYMPWRSPGFQQFILDTAYLEIPELSSWALLWGQIDSLATQPQITMTATFDFSAEDTISLTNDLSMKGKIRAEMEAKFQQPMASIEGEINFSRLNVFFGQFLSASGIQGTLPFAQKLDTETSNLIADDFSKSMLADVGLINYSSLRPYYLSQPSFLPRIEIKRIQVMDYSVSDLNIDILLGNSRLQVPRFALNLYDGNMAGSFWLNFGTGSLDQMEYEIKANISRLNSAKLSPVGSGEAEKSELNANMKLVGRGLDPQKKMDFNGYFYITKIGPRFADNVLKSLDPKGTDQGIQDTRMLLNRGFKPRLMSFDIKHGYFYPVIILSQPWYSPIRLSGGKIELARIPIKFFLQNQLQRNIARD